ncbi:MAG: type III-B CRISPR-associated protein Cas10/Cmr2, partial [Cyanobacteria bacterium J06638_22]
MTKDKDQELIEIAIAWCLAWGEDLEPQTDLETLSQMQEAMSKQGQIPDTVRSYVENAQTLNQLPYPQTLEALADIAQKHSTLWESKIGLVYGGATKI